MTVRHTATYLKIFSTAEELKAEFVFYKSLEYKKVKLIEASYGDIIADV